MSDTGKVACARGGCHRVVHEHKALWINDLPYCSDFCFDREHHGKTPQAPAQMMLLQEN